MSSEHNPTVGVMIPTRRRVALLERCLDTLHDKTHDYDAVELLLKVDDDDVETLEFLQQGYVSDIELKYVVTPRYNGYGSLHVFYDMLAGISRASHVMVYNDDVEMLTDGWERCYEPYRGTGYVIGLRSLGDPDSPAGEMFGGQFTMFDRGENGYNGNPAIPRKFLQAFGTLSHAPMIDDWWVEVLRDFPSLTKWVDVDILFRRPDGVYSRGEADATYTEGRQHINWRHHGSPELVEYRQNLLRFIMNNGEMFV